MRRLKVLYLLAIFFTLVLLGGAQSAVKTPREHETTAAILTGTIRIAGGQKFEGAAVSARASDSSITTTVYTDEQGHYVFPALRNGDYQVWAQAVGYEMNRAELTLSSGPSKRDFVLEPIKDFTQQLSGAEWMDSLPGETRQDRRAKLIFSYNCTQCHPSAFPLQNVFDQKGWPSSI